MKKLIFLATFALVALFSSQAHAQTTFNVKTGMSFAFFNMENSVEEYSGTRNGFTIGASVEQQLSERWALEFGFMYNRKGSEWDNNTAADNLTTINYIDFPLLAKAYFPISENVKMYVAAGAYAGIACGGDTDYNREQTSKSISIGNDEYDEFKRWDYGASFGIGMEVKKFTLGISYDLGLADVGNADNYYDESDPNYSAPNNLYYTNESFKNNVARVTVGYRFGPFW